MEEWLDQQRKEKLGGSREKPENQREAELNTSCGEAAHRAWR